MNKKGPLLFVILMLCAYSANAADVGNITIHGFLSQGWLKSDKNNYLADTQKGTFEYDEAGINFTTVMERLRIGMQVFARDLGDSGENRIIVDWATADYHWKDELGFRAGRVKMPLGLFSSYRDADMLKTPILMPGAMYDEATRDFGNVYNGFGAYGNISLAGIGGLEYELFLGTLDMDTDDSIYIRGIYEKLTRGVSRMMKGISVEQQEGDMNVKYCAGGQLRWYTPFDALHLGASFITVSGDMNLSLSAPQMNIRYDADMNIEHSAILSAEYSKWGINFASEAQFMLIKLRPQLSIPSIPVPISMDDVRTRSLGWYVMASYQFRDFLTAGVYYSEFYPDTSDKTGENLVRQGQKDYYAWQKEIVPTIRIDINKNWLIKFETHFVNGAANVYDFNNPEGRDKNWILYAVKTTFSF